MKSKQPMIPKSHLLEEMKWDYIYHSELLVGISEVGLGALLLEPQHGVEITASSSSAGHCRQGSDPIGTGMEMPVQIKMEGDRYLGTRSLATSLLNK